MEKAARRKLTTYKKQTGSMDFSILLVVTILCAFGLVMVFSASYYYAIHTQNGDGATITPSTPRTGTGTTT